MQVTVSINKCGDCRYKDHSGNFTPGGAIDTCSHQSAPKSGRLNGKRASYEDIKTREDAEQVFGPQRIDWKKAPPDWCPLRNGSRY